MFSKGVFQNDDNDCGAAALATILKLFKKSVPLHTVKKHTVHSNMGSSIWDISNGSKLFGLGPNELCGNNKELNEAIKSKEVRFPFIAHIIKEDDQYHFIVVIKKSFGKFLVFDPAHGSKLIKVEDFFRIWTGNIITFEKQENFQKRNRWIYFLESIYILNEFRIQFFLALFLTLLVSMLSIFSANFYQVIVDKHIIGLPESQNTFGSILSKIDLHNISNLILSFVIFLILQNLFSMVIEFVLIGIGEKLEKKISRSFFEKVFSLTISFFYTKRTGDFITRLQDIETIVNFLSITLLKFSINIIMGILGVVVLVNIQAQLFLIMITGLVIYTIVSLYVIPRLSRITKSLIEQRASLYSRFKENIDTIESIKVIQQEDFFLNKLSKVSKKFIKLKKESSCLISFFSFIINNIDSITQGLILYFGIFMILDNQFTLGGFLSFQSLMAFFISPIKELLSIQYETQEYMISYERLREYMEGDSETYATLPEKLNDNNDIHFDNVSFSYDKKNKIIENFTKTLKSGAKIYIEGKNGSGKTTLVKLLNKILIPDDGEIYLGNCPYNSLPVNLIRNKVSYATQNNYIFEGSFKQNLFVDMDSNRNDVGVLNHLITSGILDNIISKLEYGWETQINENGTNLSEGQKQIIGICRLLILGTPIMIFDESISKIDTRTQGKLIEFIFEHFSGNTCIFIDHGSKMRDKCTEVICLDF